MSVQLRSCATGKKRTSKTALKLLAFVADAVAYPAFEAGSSRSRRTGVKAPAQVKARFKAFRAVIAYRGIEAQTYTVGSNG